MQKRLGAQGGRLQHGSTTDPAIKSISFHFLMVLSPQGKEGVYSLTEGHSQMAVGEHSLTPVTTRSKWCTTRIYGASLLDLLLGKQVLRPAKVLKNSFSALCRNSELVN